MAARPGMSARGSREEHAVTLAADQIEQLKAAISAQERLRPVLGDESVDAAISLLQAQLNTLFGRDAAGGALTTEQAALNALQARVPAALADKARRTEASRRSEVERRNVTVLFADLTGFTALGERFDPEIIREFQDDLFDEIASVVYAHEGFVEKFVGDAVLAIFGAPLTHEDDPARALRAALAMRERMDGINERWVERLGQPLQLHIGVNSGPVVAGQIGTERGGGYSVTGDTINTASRLQTAAEPGQVLVSGSTYRLARESFTFHQLKSIKVRGKREPVTLYELIRAKLFPGTGRGVRGLDAPIVGRAAEIKKLKGITEALTAGTGQVVIVAGEAGIGKSRLMAEWRRSLEKDIRWLEGRSYAGASGVPYGPFADLTRRYVGISDEDSESRAGSRLRQALQRVLPGGLEANALVGSMLGMRLERDEEEHLATHSPQEVQQRLFALVEDLLRRLAQQQPTVLVLEDLHWADDSSLELVQHLLPLVRQVPLAIVGVLRRGEAEIPWLPVVIERYADRLTHLELVPLARKSTVTLVEELLSSAGSLPDAVQELIIGKAEGNPFFVEEVIRTLIERGALERSADGRRWEMTSRIEGITVPDTLQGVLMARLDRLGKEAKRIAQQAAVIGRIFQQRVLLKVAEDVARLEADLGHLEREELIRELRRDPDLEYIFKHALTQEVAYETLTTPQRRDLHARVGAALEELVADRIGEYQAILGNHFLRGEVWDKAAAYYREAGDAAARLHAYPEASAHYANARQALHSLPPNDDIRRQIIDLTLNQMGVSWGAEDPGSNLAKLAEAEALARALTAGGDRAGPDRVRLARIQYWIGRIHYYRDEPREAIAYFQQVLAVGQELGDEGLLAIPLAVMGRALVVQGHFDRAIPVLARALGPLEKTDEWLDWSFSKAYHGVAIAAGGQHAEGLAETQEAVARARETKNPTALAGCLIVLAFHGCLSRDAQAFREAANAASAAGRLAGNSLMISVGLGFEAWALSRLGRHDEAEARMSEAIGEADKIGGRIVAADWIAAANAELALTAGRPDEAVARAAPAIEKARAIGGIYGEAVAQRIWGQALARLQPSAPEEADLHLATSMDLFQEGGCKLEVAHTHAAWGALLHDRGDLAGAADHFGHAAELLKAAGMPKIAKAAAANLRAARKEINVS
ncbi:MAG: adenylate/guanylate cyclase domain-containing protein [Chloroflexota bacterium]